MTDQHHPITPPPSLVQQWIAEIWHEGTPVQVAQSDLHLATRAAAWGYEQRGEVNEAKLQKARDQELEACVAWLDGFDEGWAAEQLRADRRPKPQSLAKTATYELDEAVMRGDCITTTDAMPHLRAALKRLAELEDSNG